VTRDKDKPFDPLKVTESEIYRFIYMQWQHHNQLSWNKLNVLLALQTAILAGSFYVRPYWLGCCLLVVGTLVSIIVYFLMRRDSDVRDGHLSIIEKVLADIPDANGKQIRVIPDGAWWKRGQHLLRLLLAVIVMMNIVAFLVLLPATGVRSESGGPELLSESRSDIHTSADERVAVATELLVYVTALLALFTGGLWVATYQLSRRAKHTAAQQARDTERSLRIAEKSADAIKALERGQVYAVPMIATYHSNAPSTVQMQVLNYGKTPANVEKLSWRAVPFLGEPWVMPDDLPITLVVRKIVRPGNEPIIVPIQLDLNGTDTIAFYGRVYFSDVFGDKWSASWAYRMEPSQDWNLFSLDAHAQLRHEGKYNDTAACT
jgi:hypothetical protein